jgi:hypothetical protein
MSGKDRRMIRPWTAISFVLAAGAVLYTYRSKHEVQLLDRQIEKTLADTAGLREQSRALQAEWTLRENPERLRTFADQFLSLKPMLPTQFTTLADLDTRLPAPRAMPLNTGTTEEPAEAPVASTVPPAPSPDETFAEAEELPIPPLHVPPPPSMAPSMAMAANAVPAAPKPAPPFQHRSRHPRSSRNLPAWRQPRRRPRKPARRWHRCRCSSHKCRPGLFSGLGAADRTRPHPDRYRSAQPYGPTVTELRS